MWYFHSLEPGSIIQNLTILENKTGHALSNTRVQYLNLSGTLCSPFFLFLHFVFRIQYKGIACIGIKMKIKLFSRQRKVYATCTLLFFMKIYHIFLFIFTVLHLTIRNLYYKQRLPWTSFFFNVNISHMHLKLWKLKKKTTWNCSNSTHLNRDYRCNKPWIKIHPKHDFVIVSFPAQPLQQGGSNMTSSKFWISVQFSVNLTVA